MKRNFVSGLVRHALIATAVVLGATSVASAQRPIPVNIESVPAGATVYLDTTTGAPLGTTPLSSVRIARGSHTLIFQMENYEEARLTITVSRRRETFRAVLRALGTIEVSAGNDSARGATVYVDGAPVGGGTLGSLPIRVPNLPPGRHQVRVERDGYVTYEEWVTVEGGQTVRLTAMLEAVAPETGSILIDVDVRGAPIYVDGVDSGRVTNTVLDNISVGTHEIEIRAEGMEPFRQTVLVRQGERVEIHATLAPAGPTGGRLTVVISPAAAAAVATVMIDGDVLPSGSRSRTDMEPGSHVVQVTAPGYDEVTQTVTVVAGEAATASITMTATRGEPTDINLQASVPGATIVVDGESHPAPYVADETEPSTHSIVVRADGFEEVSFTCSTAPGAGDDADCQRTVTLEPLRVHLRVALDGEPDLREGPAVLYIDDQEIGPVPYEGRIETGSHVFEVRAEGYGTYREQVVVEYGEGDVTITARLTDNSEVAAASATTHSALPTPAGHPTIDLSIGWPYLGEVRLGIGLHELVDAGFAIRSFGRITEFEGRARFGVRVIREIAMGALVRFGGGVGPSTSLGVPTFAGSVAPGAHEDVVPTTLAGTRNATGYPVNTAFFSIEYDLTLLLEPIAAVTLWAGGDFVSDEYAGHPRNEHVFLDVGPGGASDVICTVPPMTTSTMEGWTLTCPQQRQTMARFRIGGAVEIAVDRHWGVWAIFEGIVAEPSDSRRLLGGFIFDAQDIRIYPRLGVTFKF